MINVSRSASAASLIWSVFVLVTRVLLVSSPGSCVRAVGSLRLHPKISGSLLRGVHRIAVYVTNIFAVTFVCLAGCNHIATSPISHSPSLLLFRFPVVTSLGFLSTLSGHVQQPSS